MATEEAPEWGKEENGGTLLYTPFNEEFVEALKEEIPASKRRWLPDEEAWWVHDDFVDAVETLLLNHFEDYEG